MKSYQVVAHKVGTCAPETPTCADFDEDCPEVECKVSCWLYDPARGMCPYLRQKSSPEYPPCGMGG